MLIKSNESKKDVNSLIEHYELLQTVLTEYEKENKALKKREEYYKNIETENKELKKVITEMLEYQHRNDKKAAEYDSIKCVLSQRTEEINELRLTIDALKNRC